jgi:hypothetical protein
VGALPGARNQGDELARRRAKVRQQRLAVDPALKEHKPQAVVRIGPDAVLKAARLGPRAGDMLEAQVAQLVERVERAWIDPVTMIMRQCRLGV